MCKVLHENCDPKFAQDKSLPVNSYVVTYLLDTKVCYDIVICHKRVDVFDMYWDKHRSDLKSIEYTEGRISAKLWGYQQPDKKKKK
jgi:hypothetical protein